LREVAEETGLSTAGVSYALRGIQTSKETQERVRAAAARLGYEADPIARALASGRTGTVGVLFGSLEDLWQQRLAAALGRQLLSGDAYALVVDAGGSAAREYELAQRLRDQRVDALLVSPVDPASARWSAIAEAVPLVSIGEPLTSGKPAGTVVFDNPSGITAGLEHLHALGHRRLAILAPNRRSARDWPAARHVSTEAERLSVEITVVSSSYVLTEATTVARDLLSASRRPTALFCLSDSIAHGVYAAAAELGLSIPDELSVMGFDNQPVSGVLAPPLTGFDWDLDGIVDSTVQLLEAAIEGRSRRRRVVRRPMLRLGASTAAPAVGSA
jgi:LacI family transcriptional regulator